MREWQNSRNGRGVEWQILMDDRKPKNGTKEGIAPAHIPETMRKSKKIDNHKMDSNTCIYRCL